MVAPLLYLCIHSTIKIKMRNCEINNNASATAAMPISEVAGLLKAEILTPELELTREVVHAFSSDLMSDVLTGDYYKTVLVTGLSNLQAIRTAEMSDINQIIVARNKNVSQEMIELARENDIVLIKSSYSMFRISGILYEAGIKPLF